MISVLIPAYNAADTLSETLDSVLAQTYGEWEAVVVDDGSSDSTLEIARKYALQDPRIRVVHNDHCGVAVSRNTALENCRGQWIVWLDGDDLLHPASLETMLEIARKSRADVVHAMLHRSKSIRWKTLTGRYVIIDGGHAWIEIMYQKVLNNSLSGKLFRRELFINGCFAPGRYYEDLQITPQLYNPGSKIAVCPDVVYFYRDTPGSIINTWRLRRLHALKATGILLSEGHLRGPEALAAARDRRFAAAFNMYLLTRSNHVAEVPGDCWRLIKAYRCSVLVNPRSRLKNKLGAMVSFLGQKATFVVATLLGSY